MHIDLLTQEQRQKCEQLAKHVCGSSFERAPTDWQRFVLDLVKRNVSLEIESDV